MARDREAEKFILVRAVSPTPDVAVDTPLRAGLAQAANEERRAETQTYLNQIARQIPWNGLEVQTIVLLGHSPNALVEYAKNSPADLILMATHARGGLSRMVRGSLADSMLRSVGIPLLLQGKPQERRRFIAFPRRRERTLERAA
jgi:nucleotide-binding universal stress UspA family protein